MNFTQLLFPDFSLILCGYLVCRGATWAGLVTLSTVLGMLGLPFALGVLQAL